MIKKYIRVLTILSILISLSEVSYGQDFDAVFDIGTKDANTYLKAYSEPSIAAFGNGLAGGWYNTAKPHKLWGFDLTLSGSLVTIPSEDQVFTFRNSDYQNLKVAGSTGEDGSVQLPTLTGDNASGSLEVEGGATITAPDGTVINSSLQGQAFNAPDGAEFGRTIPVPILQLGVGVVKNTDLKLRFIPKVSQDEAELSLFGIGVQHDVKQWIPGIKSLPFDLSVLLATTFMKIGYKINVGNEGDDIYFENGNAEFKVNSSTFQVIASKKLSVVTPYIGIGFNAVKSSLKVSGDLVYNASASVGGQALTAPLTFTDPVDIEFDGAGSARVTAGLRLKLAIVTFHANYTFQKYSMLNVGFGFNVR